MDGSGYAVRQQQQQGTTQLASLLFSTCVVPLSVFCSTTSVPAPVTSNNPTKWIHIPRGSDCITAMKHDMIRCCAPLRRCVSVFQVVDAVWMQSLVLNDRKNALGTSTLFQPYWSDVATGTLDTSAATNPLFFDWNMVLYALLQWRPLGRHRHYQLQCQLRISSSLDTTSAKQSSLISSLPKVWEKASSLVLSGSSVGGLGVFFLLWIAGRLLCLRLR